MYTLYGIMADNRTFETQVQSFVEAVRALRHMRKKFPSVSVMRENVDTVKHQHSW